MRRRSAYLATKSRRYLSLAFCKSLHPWCSRRSPLWRHCTDVAPLRAHHLRVTSTRSRNGAGCCEATPQAPPAIKTTTSPPKGTPDRSSLASCGTSMTTNTPWPPTVRSRADAPVHLPVTGPGPCQRTRADISWLRPCAYLARSVGGQPPCMRLCICSGTYTLGGDTLTSAALLSGRAWAASELRLKSFEDLQQIWLLCVREQNHVYTWSAWNRAAQRTTTDPAKQRRNQSSPGGRLKQVCVSARWAAVHALCRSMRRCRAGAQLGSRATYDAGLSWLPWQCHWHVTRRTIHMRG